MVQEEREYLYLKGTEELGDVVDAIKNVESKEIVLVVPRNTKCLLHPTNLEILKHEANKHRKKIYISTEDDRLSSLAKNVGLEIFLEDFEYQEASKIVTDIIPPSKVKPKIVIKEETKTKSSSKKRNYKKSILTIVILLIVITGALIFLSNLNASATIEVYLKKQKIPFEETIILDPNATSADLEKAILPAEFVEITKNHTVKQPTSGTKASKPKPSGKIALINEDPQNSISIIQGTRIQSEKGNIYRTTERVYLEPKSSKEVYVISEKAGSEYEITDLNTKFTIPGLIGTRWENLIKAKLVEPIITGENTTVVTVDDINEGKIKLEKELKEVILQELAIKYKDYIFPDDINLVDIKILDISHSVGQPTKEILITGSGKLQSIGVKKSKFEEFIKDLLSKANLKENKDSNILDVKINRMKLLNLEIKSKSATVLVEGELTAQGYLNTKKLVEELVGKNLAEAKNIFNKYPVIEKAELTIKPFWLNSLPFDASKINVKIK
jgi:hypothetical protein